jgi:type II secretory pathway pseudopilin PulG
VNIRYDKNNARLPERSFTLVEILIAITIVLLITAVAVTRIGTPHSSMTARAVCGKIEDLLGAAQRRAAMTGRRVTVAFHSDTRTFVLDGEGAEGDVEDSAEKPVHPLPKSLELRVPEGVEVEAVAGNGGRGESAEDADASFYFYPDGSAGGPKLTVTSGNAKFTLSVSRLTGLVVLKKEEGE